MDKIYRLDYLENILPRKDAKLALIAPGLHDGEEMLETMSGIIFSNKETRFFLKPHPLANNTYANKYQKSPNLVITGDSIQDLLSQVSVVYVTYSSVGLEALKMEIAVRVVEIPGVINQSPLGDLKNYESMVIRSN
jgi:capsule polysaccharide export protein KpsC/LpsZ